ncbi:MAG TPA: hypothetical protein VEB66_08660 [Opitutaceae bacterium]|nr:hypothetical protein [Opitutaceae bacterium]
MAGEILINLAVEDTLTEQLLRALLEQSRREYLVGAVYGKRGAGFLRKNLKAFNNAARGSTYLVVADLDDEPCAPRLAARWFDCPLSDHPKYCHRNLLFRVAVREIEAWVMADRDGFSKFVGVGKDLIPSNTESLTDPKSALVAIARRSRFRDVRDDIVPRDTGSLRIGPNYNPRLSEFLRSGWRASRACNHSDSLARIFEVLNTHTPIR